MTEKGVTARLYRSAWFVKAARKARISDHELCGAITQVMGGRADDLGGGVFKKRLNKNDHRAIILSKGRNFWIYEYLFAKNDRDDINDAELKAFRMLVKSYLHSRLNKCRRSLMKKIGLRFVRRSNDEKEYF